MWNKAVEADLGEILTRWSIRASVVCYLLRLYVDLLRTEPPRTSIIVVTRRVWTIGFVLYALHVYCAFEFVHDWSHRSALRDTAEQTAAVTGLYWGGGLYVNYVFSLLWMFDVAAWWLLGPIFPYRRPAYRFGLHAVFGFMMFNATVVFGPPVWRLAGLVVVMVAAAVLVVRSVRRARDRPKDS